MVASETDGGRHRQWSSAGLPGLDASTITLLLVGSARGHSPQPAIASALAPDGRVHNRRCVRLGWPRPTRRSFHPDRFQGGRGPRTRRGDAFPPPPEYGSIHATVKRAARFFGKENRRIPLPLVEFSRTRVRSLLIRPSTTDLGYSINC